MTLTGGTTLPVTLHHMPISFTVKCYPVTNGRPTNGTNDKVEEYTKLGSRTRSALPMDVPHVAP